MTVTQYAPMQEYPKLSQAYYILLECLAQDHITYLSTLEPQVFLYILESISEGLSALGKPLATFAIQFQSIFISNRHDDLLGLLFHTGLYCLLHFQTVTVER